MASTKLQYLSAAFQAFERLDEVETEADLGRAFGAAIGEFGFENFLVVSSRIQPTLFPRMILLDTWPSGWRQQYTQENLFPCDPVAILARKSFDSFAWDEAPVRSRSEQRVMQVSATDYNLRRGFCIPIHGPAGYQATVSIAGRDVDISREARIALEMIAFFAYRKDLKLRSVCKTFRLTPREREIMRWAAAGKSAWDTASILCISEQTVKSHVSSVLAKLEVCTKAQAVAESIRRGEIEP